jgi:hypothetical protein
LPSQETDRTIDIQGNDDLVLNSYSGISSQIVTHRCESEGGKRHKVHH